MKTSERYLALTKKNYPNISGNMKNITLKYYCIHKYICSYMWLGNVKNITGEFSDRNFKLSGYKYI